MVAVSAPFSELPPASLILQSSRFSPTEGKLASHCIREVGHAVRRSIGIFSRNRWKCGCCNRSRRLGSSIGMSDRSSPFSLRPKGGDESQIAVGRGSQFEKNSLYDGYGRKGIRPKIVSWLEECIHPRCFGFPRWSKEHWEPCCQRSHEQVYDRRPLVEKILDHLLV